MGGIWDKNTAQTKIIQSVSRAEHCVSAARSAVSANPLLSLLILWLETSQRHLSRERENPCAEMHTERNRTNQFSESFNGLVFISKIPVPLAQGLIETNDPAEETQLSGPSASVIR